MFKQSSVEPHVSDAESRDSSPFTHTRHVITRMCRRCDRITRANMKVTCDELFNQIKQDLTSDARLRSYHSDSLVNYGFLPQTWENPHLNHPHTGFK